MKNMKKYLAVLLSVLLLVAVLPAGAFAAGRELISNSLHIRSFRPFIVVEEPWDADTALLAEGNDVLDEKESEEDDLLNGIDLLEGDENLSEEEEELLNSGEDTLSPDDEDDDLLVDDEEDDLLPSEPEEFDPYAAYELYLTLTPSEQLKYVAGLMANYEDYEAFLAVKNEAESVSEPEEESGPTVGTEPEADLTEVDLTEPETEPTEDEQTEPETELTEGEQTEPEAEPEVESTESEPIESEAEPTEGEQTEPEAEPTEDESTEAEEVDPALLAAYEAYLAMTEEEQAEYLASLTEEELAAFNAFLEARAADADGNKEEENKEVENTEAEEVDPKLLAAYEAYRAMTEEEQAEYLASLTEEELAAFNSFVEARAADDDGNKEDENKEVENTEAEEVDPALLAAYEAYLAMTEEEQTEYLASLTEQELAVFNAFVEARAEEKKDVENTEAEEVDPALLAAYEAYLAMTEEEQAEYLASLTEEEIAVFNAFVEARDEENKEVENTESEEVDPALLAAYEAYLAMTEEDQAEYLASLTEEELTVFNAFLEAQTAKEVAEKEDSKETAETPEQEEPEYEVKIHVDIENDWDTGESIGYFYSEIIGDVDMNNVAYQWQISYDGETWADIPGAMDPELVVVFDKDNAFAHWHVLVEILEDDFPDNNQEQAPVEDIPEGFLEEISLPVE